MSDSRTSKPKNVKMPIHNTHVACEQGFLRGDRSTSDLRCVMHVLLFLPAEVPNSSESIRMFGNLGD